MPPERLYSKIISALSYHLSLRAASVPKDKLDFGRGDIGELGGIATLEKHREKGHMQSLVHGMLEDLEKNGKKAVVTTVISPQAAWFLKRLGWEEAGDSWVGHGISQKECEDLLAKESGEEFERFMAGPGVAGRRKDTGPVETVGERQRAAVVWLKSNVPDTRLYVIRSGPKNLYFFSSERFPARMFRRIGGGKKG